MAKARGEDWFHVVGLFRALGFEPVKEHTWVAGNLMREVYERQTGQLPEKRLMPKTNGGGSHMHAMYPPMFRPKAEEIIRSIAKERERQGSLL